LERPGFKKVRVVSGVRGAAAADTAHHTNPRGCST